MTERTRLLAWFDEAVATGARRFKVAELMGLSQRTLKRWRDAAGKVLEDGRPGALKPEQPKQLTREEEDRILIICNMLEYRSLPPSQIVPKLADLGVYVASESTFYRVLKKNSQLNERGRANKRQKRPQPDTFIATGPNQVYTWDISYMPSAVKGQHWYLYLVLDIYSRKIVAWEVHDCESGKYAKKLIERALVREKCLDNPPVLHSDNGAPMTSYTLRSRLGELGMLMSYSRPRVSNDNPYSEAAFRTVKYCPKWPSKGFKSIEHAREWMLEFEYAYNEIHLHSGINFVTPGARHRGEDKAILEQRERVYQAAKAKHPERWSGSYRDWSQITEVALNPTREQPEKHAA